ncbi:MAG TPA: fructose-1,6-bisphosphate aldolase, class II [Clostridiales bacterium]|jgi:fructose-bisphosphate aldolase class II|nr:class II fructose-1,6-bisphosphate aldolase [Clostridium sp.]MEE1379583.1 class II fructose-1,6-bisphosphate aldolase [Clostridia bacterium]HCQ55325.1 fructose-1,6-bisphosphate aldolase, class II [Clostridiales bacterium]
MPLVTTKEMFEKSMKEGFAIGAFNVNNMELIQGIVDAAAENNSPVILQASSSAIKYARINYLMKMVEAAVEEHPNIPIAIHLDHGPDFETCKMCVDNGFTSVMFDGSKYDFEENIRLTKEVVDYAHAHGVVVEAELGKLAGIEDDVNVSASDAMYTDPAQAEEFVRRTGVDSLAIAIGTSHGAYKFKGEAKLRFDILKQIKERIPNTPIVLHGASTVIPELVNMCNEYGGNIPGAKGVPDEILHEASISGVSKINVDTDLRLAMTAGIRKVFVEDPSAFDPRKYLIPARELVKETVSHKMKDVFGSANKA